MLGAGRGAFDVAGLGFAGLGVGLFFGLGGLAAGVGGGHFCLLWGIGLRVGLGVWVVDAVWWVTGGWVVCESVRRVWVSSCEEDRGVRETGREREREAYR